MRRKKKKVKVSKAKKEKRGLLLPKVRTRVEEREKKREFRPWNQPFEKDKRKGGLHIFLVPKIRGDPFSNLGG